MRPKKYQKLRYPIVEQLREIRIAQGIPSKVLCRKIGYDKNALGRWERGENLPSFQALNNWCEALGADLCASPRLTPR